MDNLSSRGQLDALLSIPRLGAAAVSPDGCWVAWTWFGIGPVGDVYAAPTDGSRGPVRLTETDQDTVLVHWTPDSAAVLVEQDHDGDERVRLFRVALDAPGEMEPLTEDRPPYYLRGGSLHPNGRWLVYAMNFDVVSGREIEATWVYRHDLETGERRPLARPEKATSTTPSLNEQGNHVLYTRQDVHPAGNQAWLVDIDGRNDREILNFGADVKVEPSWFPDGRRVLFVADSGTHRRLGVRDLETEEIRWLLDDPARDIESAHVPRGSEPDVGVVIEVKGARTRASLLDVESGEETPLPDVPGSLVPFRPVGDDAIGRYYSATQPAELIRFSPGVPRMNLGSGLTRIWERTSLRPEDLVPAEDFRWHSVDGLEIQGWLYRARGEKRGTIIQVHGGPTSHAEDAFLPAIQYYASQGFHVLAPNYRGSTGFGLAYQEAIKEDGWGGREQDDIRTGIEALIAAGIAQRGRVGVTGTSYGGYSSWCAITRWPVDLVAAAVPICGMTDLRVDYETTRPDLRPYSEEMMGGTPHEVPERYWERSPINFVENIRGALLIVQGARDPNVTPANVRVVREALDRAEIPYQVLIFEDEGHGIARPENQQVLFERIVAFMARAFT